MTTAEPGARATGTLPLVVKLGGSLVTSGRLPFIVQAVVAATRPVVVVPGGGPFVDAVRAAQGRYKFGDASAHRMALLAMHQTAVMLCAMAFRFVTAETLKEISTAISEGRIPVWQPLRLAGADPGIPANWSITSDGLAAWLAERLGGAPVVLLKSVRAAAGATADALAREGVVDAVFADRVQHAGLEWRIFGPGEEAALSALLAAPGASAQPQQPVAGGSRSC